MRVLGPLISDPQTDSQSAVAPDWDADAGSRSAPGYPPAGGKGRPLMIMGDLPARPAPEPLDPIGLGVIRGRVDDPQMVVQLGQHLAHQTRSCWGVSAEVIHNHDGRPAPGTRPRDSRPHLGTKDIRRAAGSQAPLKPPVAPVDEFEAIELVVRTRRLDEALATAAFAAPDPRQGGMGRRTGSHPGDRFNSASYVGRGARSNLATSGDTSSRRSASTRAVTGGGVGVPAPARITSTRRRFPRSPVAPRLGV